MLLGLGGGFWLTSVANAQSAPSEYAPQSVQAEPAQVELSVERQPNETYQDLLRRAKASATAAAAARFNQDALLTNVSLMLVAENQGAIAPVLSLSVSRSQWLSNSDADSWFTYFNSARSLLKFEDVATGTKNTGINTQVSNPTPSSRYSQIPMRGNYSTPGSKFNSMPTRGNFNPNNISTPKPPYSSLVTPGTIQSPNSSNNFQPVVPTLNPAMPHK